MNYIEILPTEDSPHVILNGNDKKLRISGKSFPENAADIFNPVLSKLVTLDTSQIDEFTVEFDIEYFCTSSMKYLYEIMNLLNIKFINRLMLVKWYFDEEDEDMKTLGMDFSDIFNTNFELIPYAYRLAS